MPNSSMEHERLGTQGKQATGLYWGWYVVGGAFLVTAINYGARYFFGIFVNPLELEYHWSRSIISGAASLMMISYGISGIFIGRLLDRMAPRTLIMIGVAVVAAGFVLTSLTGLVVRSLALPMVCLPFLSLLEGVWGLFLGGSSMTTSATMMLLGRLI